jgi:phage shock protein C
MSVNRGSRLLPDGLVRDTENGKIAGVCAGLGGYFGIKTKWVRVGFILMCIFIPFPATFAAYVILALMMPVAPSGFAYDSFDEKGQPNPVGSQDGLREHFLKLDHRLANMEAWVTSEDYRLRQKFRDL